MYYAQLRALSTLRSRHLQANFVRRMQEQTRTPKRKDLLYYQILHLDFTRLIYKSGALLACMKERRLLVEACQSQI